MNNVIQRAPDLRGQLRDHLERRLRLGIYPDDVKLMEHGVAREFSVSRTPAREALAMLARDGMLARVGRGYRRVQFSVADIENVFEARLRLEPYAAGLVASNAKPLDIERLTAAIRAMAEQLGDAHGYMDALAALRRQLFDATGNAPLIRLISLYEGQVAYVRAKTLQDEATRRLSLSGNRRLVQAIAEHDPAAAEREILALLHAAKAAILEILALNEQEASQAAA